MLDREYYIRSELLKSGIHFRESRTNFKIRCFDSSCDSGEHKSHPYKLEITKDGSKAHCWRCDWSGSWNSLAPKLGLTPFFKLKEDYFDDVDIKEVVSKPLNVTKELDSIPALPENIEIWNGLNNDGKEWRNLSTSFLSIIPTYLWHQIDDFGHSAERILFPFYQWGKFVGYTGRRLDDSDVMRYDTSGKAKKILFPFDYVRNHFADTTKMVLVEGPVDALILNQYGIPALSFLGTSNWKPCKIDLLISLGVKKVMVLMDGDSSGQKAAVDIINGVNDKNKKIVRLDSVMDKVKNIKLPKGKDPAELNEIQLNWLKNQFDKL